MIQSSSFSSSCYFCTVVQPCLELYELICRKSSIAEVVAAVAVALAVALAVAIAGAAAAAVSRDAWMKFALSPHGVFVAIQYRRVYIRYAESALIYSYAYCEPSAILEKQNLRSMKYCFLLVSQTTANRKYTVRWLASGLILTSVL